MAHPPHRELVTVAEPNSPKAVPHYWGGGATSERSLLYLPELSCRYFLV
jgi:hypothetical protein